MKTVGKIIIILALIGVVIVGVKMIKAKKDVLEKAKSMKSYNMIVSSMTPVSKEEVLTLPYLALVQSQKNVALASRISARIKYIKKCGKKVHKNELLVKLDENELLSKKQTLKLQILSLKAEIYAKKSILNTTLQSHERTKKLLAVKGASQESYDKESSNIASLKAILVSLQNQVKIIKESISQIDTSLSYTTLRSPINGIVSKCFANIGDISIPTKPILEIESKDGKYLLVRFSNKTKAKALLFNGVSYPLVSMSSTYNGLNEYRAYIDTNLATGNRVNISLIIYKAKGIRLPLNALLQKDSKTYCFIVQGDKAEPIEVKVVAQGEEGVIVEGLKENTEIVVAKPDILLKLLAGTPISVRN